MYSISNIGLTPLFKTHRNLYITDQRTNKQTNKQKTLLT